MCMIKQLVEVDQMRWYLYDFIMSHLSPYVKTYIISVTHVQDKIRIVQMCIRDRYWPVIGQNWEFIRSHGQFTNFKCSFAYKKNTPFLALTFLKFKLHHVFLYIIMSILIPYLHKLVIIKGDFPPYKISTNTNKFFRIYNHTRRNLSKSGQSGLHHALPWTEEHQATTEFSGIVQFLSKISEELCTCNSKIECSTPEK